MIYSGQDHHDITELLLKEVLNTNQSILVKTLF